jgi:hypothetical protein
MSGQRPGPGGRRGLLICIAVALVAAASAGVPFTERSSAAEPVVLVGAGDIATCSNQNDEATAAILDDTPGTVITLGDNNYGGELLADFEQCYGPTWGRHKDRTRPAIGNHEYATPGATGYFDYFGAVAGDRAQGYYSYEAGAWHVVVLNSNCGKVGGCDAGSAQEQWLRQDLAASPAACTLAYWHHPRFSSGGHGDGVGLQPLWKALWENGTELLLTGHDHDYERFAPLGVSGTPDPEYGVREFVVGTGGVGHGSLPTVHAFSEVRNNDTFGVMKLTLSDDAYGWDFLPVAGATFTDSGAGTCHGRPPDTQAPSTTITSGPSSSTTDPDATFTFTADDPDATFTCSLDGVLPTACSSPYTVSGLSTGQHVLRITAVDALGNAEGSPASWTWSVSGPGDESATTFVAAADAHVAQGRATTNFGSAQTLVVDGDPRTDAYLRFDLTGLTGTVTSARLRLYPSNGSSNGPRVQLASNAWSEGGLTWENRPSPTTVVANAGRVVAGTVVDLDVTAAVGGDGGYTFALVPEVNDGVDVASRESTTGRAPELVVTTSATAPDTTAPTTTILSGPPSSESTSAELSFVSSEPGSTFHCSLDAEPAQDCTSPLQLTDLAVGPHQVAVTATDTAGNTDLTPDTWSWTVLGPTDTSTFAPTDDTYVRQRNPNTNYGTGNTLLVDGSPRMDGFVKFAVAGLTGPVSDARLRFWVTDPTSNGPALRLTDTGWSETGLTWNTRPAAGTTVANAGRLLAGAWWEVDVTSVVAGNGSYAFTLVPDINNGVDLATRETGPATAPQLVVTSAQ